MRNRSPSAILSLAFSGLLAAGCADQALTPTQLVPDPSSARVTAVGPPVGGWVEEIFIDRRVEPTHAGPGPHPTEESSRYALIQGGVRWLDGGTVAYEITGTQAVSGGNDVIEAAVATIAGFVTTRGFARNDASPTDNPCGGSNRVVWAAIDGPGNVLAQASVCRNPATKEIAGFAVTLDSGDDWSTSGEAGKIDVGNVTVHELGHVAGLDHVNAPRDGCLTMYTYAAPGEVQKRTLGLGDKLGMNALYGSADVGAGGCGS